MEVTIFNKITTEGVITSIEENSKKYHVGFYADMNNAPERKLVKESASEIGGIIKELEAARISITRANTAAVNKEHSAILERLKVANAPFQTLIDEYAASRKVILDAEKARKQAVIKAEQLELDHEMGLLINKTFEYDRLQFIAKELELEKSREKERKEYADEQVKVAIKRKEDQLKVEEQSNINAENARLANKEHCAKINRDSLNELIDKCGLTPTQAKEVVSALARKQLQHIQINY